MADAHPTSTPRAAECPCPSNRAPERPSPHLSPLHGPSRSLPLAMAMAAFDAKRSLSCCCCYSIAPSPPLLQCLGTLCCSSTVVSSPAGFAALLAVAEAATACMPSWRRSAAAPLLPVAQLDRARHSHGYQRPSPSATLLAADAPLQRAESTTGRPDVLCSVGLKKKEGLRARIREKGRFFLQSCDTCE